MRDRAAPSRLALLRHIVILLQPLLAAGRGESIFSFVSTQLG